jgi:hypothetical protein
MNYKRRTMNDELKTERIKPRDLGTRNTEHATTDPVNFPNFSNFL